MAAASPAHHTTPTGAAAASERSLQGSMRPRCTIKTTMALLVALLAPLSGSTVAASSAPQLLQAGDAAAAMGDWAQAARSYSAALEADPGAILAYTKRASALAGQGKLSAALKDLGAALEAEPESNHARLQRARLYRQACNVVDARADLDAILVQKPGHGPATRELEGLQQLGDDVQALQALGERAGAAAPQDSAAALAAEAQPLLDRAYRAAPDCLPAALLEARLFMAQRQYEEAIATSGRIIKAWPGHLDALTLRGLAHMYVADHDMAKRHFGEALRYDPDHKPSKTAFSRLKDLDRRRTRATRAMEAGDYPEAEQQCRGALTVDPAHSAVNKELQLALCRALKSQSRASEAVQACRDALQLDSGYLDAHKELVRVLMAAEEWQPALDEARALLQAAQNDGDAHQLHREAERALKLSQRPDHYKALGVPRDADTRQVKSAYRELAKQYHPDKVQGSAEDKAAAEARFRDIAAAYEVLSDEERRGAYDRGEDMDQQQHPGGGPFGGHPMHFQQGGQTFTFHFG